jgi:ribonucleoside-diphosphate reductase alpha chain
MIKKYYSNEEAMIDSMKYFDADELPANVFVNKYALRDGNNDELLEKNPDDMFNRIASEFYRIESKKFKKPLSYNKIFELLQYFKYIVPSGSPLYGIGNNEKIVSLSNCYLASPPYDSYSGILKTDEQIVNISKRRGGVGVCLDNIRPEGSRTHNAAKTSTGIIPFMERYSNSIREVGQNARRGALIQILSIHHPQIKEFVTIKNDLKKVTGANISVKLSNEFLSAVKNNTTYELRFPVDYKQKNIEPIYSELVDAKEMWNVIIKNAHAMGEPGLLFWDNITNNTPADCYEEYKSEGVNPCAELPLSILDSCRLTSLNLYSYVINPFTNKAYIDYDLLHEHTMIAQRLMDDLIDLESEKIQSIIDKINKDPEPIEIKRDELAMWQAIKIHNDEGRRTGLGYMGLADLIAAIGFKYGSDESIEIVDKVGRTIKLAAYRSSVDMAKELGPFNGYDNMLEVKNPFIQQIKLEDPKLYFDMVKYGRRNISILTIPPTGTTSIEAKVSSGIEPLFAPKYTRRKKENLGENIKADFIDQNGDKWTEFEVYHPKVKEWMKITGLTDITKSPYYKSCANDIDWISRVKLQAVAGKHICHSISSTINLPNNVSVETVAKIYETAWELGLKGITVYRDGCRSGVLISSDKKEPDRIAAKRPKSLPCDIYHVNISKKLDKVRIFQYVVIVGLMDNKPYEIFALEGIKIDKKITSGNIIKHNKGLYDLTINDLDGQEIIFKSITKDNTENEDSLTRLVSLSLRHNTPIQYIVEQLTKVEGEMLCFAKSLSRSLKKYIVDGTKSSDKCIECGSSLIFNNGCKICNNCGWSKCE